MFLRQAKYRLLAEFLFVFHVAIVLVMLLGWFFPSLKYPFLFLLAATFLSELSLGYCVLTKWEFDLRKKLEPDLNYDYTFLSYYAYKLFKINIPGKYVRYGALIYLAISLIINIIRYV